MQTLGPLLLVKTAVETFMHILMLNVQFLFFIRFQ